MSYELIMLRLKEKGNINCKKNGQQLRVCLLSLHLVLVPHTQGFPVKISIKTPKLNSMV
jgi:hypothetical protein